MAVLQWKLTNAMEKLLKGKKIQYTLACLKFHYKFEILLIHMYEVPINKCVLYVSVLTLNE